MYDSAEMEKTAIIKQQKLMIDDVSIYWEKKQFLIYFNQYDHKYKVLCLKNETENGIVEKNHS